MSRPATIVISDWLANCQVGQWTPFEAATALKAALEKEGYAITATLQPDPLREEIAREPHTTVHNHVLNYRFDFGDGREYVPTESDQAMLEDAIEGYLAETQTPVPLLGQIAREAKKLNEPVTRYTRRLNDLSWTPTRSHIEGARNVMKDVADAILALLHREGK